MKKCQRRQLKYTRSIQKALQNKNQYIQQESRHSKLKNLMTAPDLLFFNRKLKQKTIEFWRVHKVYATMNQHIKGFEISQFDVLFHYLNE